MSKTDKKLKEEVNVMQEVADFANERNGLLFIVGNPIKDELYITFNGLQKLLKFPKTEDLASNVLVGVMSKSTFKGAMNEFLSGLVKTLDVNTEDGLQLYQAIAGTLQSMTLGNPPKVEVKKVNKK